MSYNLIQEEQKQTLFDNVARNIPDAEAVRRSASGLSAVTAEIENLVAQLRDRLGIDHPLPTGHDPITVMDTLHDLDEQLRKWELVYSYFTAMHEAVLTARTNIAVFYARMDADYKAVRALADAKRQEV